MQWYGDGIYAHVGTPPRAWQDVLDGAAAVRLLSSVPLGLWREIYEVDTLDWSGPGEPQRTTTQWLVGY